MKLTPLPLKGACLIDLEPKGDQRGFFARQFCKREFEDAGLSGEFVQANTSFSASRGTLRGMHYQLGESAETKIVRCIRGTIWDCILDLRPGSETFGKWFGAELNADNRRMMYVPRGFGHGFITLTDDSEVLYFVDAFYNQKLERGVRWDDPKFAIEWPAEPQVVSDKDRNHPYFDPNYHLQPVTTT